MISENEEYPDKTIDELLKQGEDELHSLTEEEYQEVQQDYEEMREGAIILLQAAALGEMFGEGKITLKEYMELADYMEELADEKDVQMP